MPDEPAKKIELKKKKKDPFDTVWKSLIVVALVILLVVGILLPIKLVPTAVSDLAGNLSSLFQSNKPVTLNKSQINSGDTFTLNLNATSTDAAKGTFTLTYPCQGGVFLEYSATGKDQDRETISCETPFTFTSTTKTITLRAVSRNTTTVEQPISIDLTPAPATTTAATSTASATSKTHFGDVTLTIKNGTPDPFSSGSTTVPENASTATSSSLQSGGSIAIGPTIGEPTTTTTHTSASGPADLAVSSVQTGVIANGQYVPTATVRSTDTLIIRFTISNRGGTPTGSWVFDTAMPTLDPQYSLYRSPLQYSVKAQSGSFYSLSVNNLRPGNQTITISADPLKTSGDQNPLNNQVTIPISVIQ